MKTGKTPADGAPLAHLYAVMLRLVVVTEAVGMGGVARAARDAHRELCPVIEHRGGSPLDYIRREEARPREDDLPCAVAQAIDPTPYLVYVQHHPVRVRS